ncbi:MAG: DUF2860 family protein [Thermodesulfobacteriota bacterium]
MERTWENPYKLNGRKETEISKSGFGFEQKFFKKLVLKYEYVSVDIKDDIIGLKFKEIKRDGTDHTANISYNFKLNEKFILNSGLKYSFKNRKGACEKRRSYGVGLTPVFFRGSSYISANLSMEKELFDEKDYIFDKKRDFIHLKLGLMDRKKLFLDNDNLFFMSGLGYLRRYSDIDFYESETMGVLISCGYRF